MKIMIRNIFIFISQFLLVHILITSALGEDDAKSPSQRIPLTDFDWDIAVSHGNGGTLMSASTTDSYEFTFPMPKLTLTANRFQPMDTPSLDAKIKDSSITYKKSGRRLTYDELEAEWSNFEVMYLVSDASKNLLYFSNYNRNLKLTNLCVFNITLNETKLLFQTFAGSVDFLLLHDGHLYFLEENRLAIMKFNISEIDFFQTQRSTWPIVVKQFNEFQINGFTINPTTGDLFWSSSKPGPNPSTIFYSTMENGTEEKVLLSTDLNHVHGLIFSDSQVYFINTPHSGQRNKIERLSLTNSAERTVLVDFEKRNHNQLPFSLTVVCGVLYWTDTVYNAVWKLPIAHPPVDSTHLVPISRVFTSRNRHHDFSILAPYAITSRRTLDAAACISRSITQKTTFVEVVEPTIPDFDPSEISMPIYVPAQNSNSDAHAASSPSLKLCGKEESALFCLNGATCLHKDQMTFCLCSLGFTGQKCELRLDGQNITNSSFVSEALDRVEDCTSGNSSLIIFTATLIAILIALSIVIVILGIKLCRLSQQPKIRRRFIVARSETQGSRLPSVNVCEMIDIENCCNMNVCETPCYDSVTGQVSLENGNHDKQRLIEY